MHLYWRSNNGIQTWNYIRIDRRCGCDSTWGGRTVHHSFPLVFDDMKKIQLTQGQVTSVDNIDYEYLLQWKWCAVWDGKNFRPKRSSSRVNGKQKNIYIYTMIAKRMGINAKRIDHKDQNPLNNCRLNLRAATVSQNGQNRSANSNNTTGVKGVYFEKSSGRYRAYIKVEGKRYNLGRFDTIAEAEKVVQQKRKELVGEFACN